MTAGNGTQTPATDTAAKELRCTFCGKSQFDVRKLIAGPTAFICDECVTLCVKICKDDKTPPEMGIPAPHAAHLTRTAAGDCTNPAFREHCTGTFSQGVTTVVVGQDSDGQLTMTVGSQPTYKLRPYQRRTFVIDGLEGFRVEFHLGPDGGADELIFHQPNGTFVARRA
jgi:hypothetical protein